MSTLSEASPLIGVAPLLFLDATTEVAKLLLCDVLAEVDNEWFSILCESGALLDVVGVLLERRLAGEVVPNMAAAIFVAGASSKVEAVVRSRDVMLLNDEDVTALAGRVRALMT